jgi:hypothetical protein
MKHSFLRDPSSPVSSRNVMVPISAPDGKLEIDVQYLVKLLISGGGPLLCWFRQKMQ